jgi:hypothetical protein
MLDLDYLGLVIQVLMAAMGAMARILNLPEPAQLKYILRQMFVAGFTGACLFWLTDVLNLDMGLMFALSGIAGWLGPKTLDWLSNLIVKKTGMPIEQTAAADTGNNEG